MQLLTVKFSSIEQDWIELYIEFYMYIVYIYIYIYIYIQAQTANCIFCWRLSFNMKENWWWRKNPFLTTAWHTKLPPWQTTVLGCLNDITKHKTMSLHVYLFTDFSQNIWGLHRNVTNTSNIFILFFYL